MTSEYVHFSSPLPFVKLETLSVYSKLLQLYVTRHYELVPHLAEHSGLRALFSEARSSSGDILVERVTLQTGQVAKHAALLLRSLDKI